MKTKRDSPGVYLPPPFFYATTFFFSCFLQKHFKLPTSFFHTKAAFYLGITCIVSGIIAALPALLSFLRSRNTLITILPAKSLQTKGIYAITRNPMYLGLLLVYTGIAFLKGNLWTFLLIPLLIILVNKMIIIKEEKYLERAFGSEYAAYKNKVRRWI